MRGSRTERLGPDHRRVRREGGVQRVRSPVGRGAAVHVDGGDVGERVHAGVRAAGDGERLPAGIGRVEGSAKLALHRPLPRLGRPPTKPVPSYSSVSFNRMRLVSWAPVQDDEWRVEVDLDDYRQGLSFGERLRALDLDDEARERLGAACRRTRATDPTSSSTRRPRLPRAKLSASSPSWPRPTT